MECNKEEALRAKDIAKRKLEDKDFAGARKFALKAQRLYPDTENISQLLCVCDVHCSAETKVSGNEPDWYGILQVEPTADDALIKKQYRKFALLLHPDKNKFAGAESAFKLIGEAQRVLLDSDSRCKHDMKRRMAFKSVVPNQALHQTSKGVNATNYHGVQSDDMSNPDSNAWGSNAPFQETKLQAQSGVANGRETFWTQCPFCAVRYQYYREILNKALRCQACKTPFIAYDLHAHTTRPASAAAQTVFPKQDAPSARVSKEGSVGVNQKPASGIVSQSVQNEKCSKSQEAKQSQNQADNGHRECESGFNPSTKANGKRRKKQAVESSESFESDSSLNEVRSNGDPAKCNAGDCSARRSNQNKQHVSYNETTCGDDETVKSSKRAKAGEFSSSLTEDKADASMNDQTSNTSKLVGAASASVNEDLKEVFKNADAGETISESIKKSNDANNGNVSSPEAMPEPIFHEYPDPEFFDFDKGREEHCFKVGQLWAAYDTVDAMPRFYAQIKRVFSRGFKLRITWLEPAPDSQNESKWANSELPFSCGKFKFGHSEDTEDRLMFSHLVSWEKGGGRGCIKIYPRKGETWALFKNWDSKWCQYPQNERKFEYEYVEVLSEFDEAVGIRVAYLGKLKGFASLFCRIDGNEVQIPPAELLRFAHRVPSYRMTGDERKDIPNGSFELDPASVTMRLEEISLSELNGKNFGTNLSSNFGDANPAVNTAEKTASCCVDKGKGDRMGQVDGLDTDVEEQELPDPEFFNFDGLKSVDNFQVNQIWALYSDVDGLPNYYGLVKKIESHPNFTLQIAWLEACHFPTKMILWKDKHMAISCGQFKVKGGNVQWYTSTSSFSHQIKADQTNRKNVFVIYPREGEVWAIYRHWEPDMTCSDLKNCEYDIVEVLEENPSYIKVSILERVGGFNSVFKTRKSGNSSFTREIPLVELLRFSHQIPSFSLTDEKDGSLRGCWELDPAALPAHVLYRLK